MTLSEIRKALGLSQRQLDLAAGLPGGTVHDLEAGRTKNPSWLTVNNLVSGLRDRGAVGLHAEDLTFGVEAADHA